MRVLIALIVVAILLAACSLAWTVLAAPPPSSQASREQALLSATSMAREFCGRLGGCPARIEIRVEAKAMMPEQDILAHTTRSAETGACVLHFTSSSIERRDVVAHEVCHCKMHYKVMGARGYAMRVTGEEMEWFEAEAAACQMKLMERGLAAEAPRG